MALEVGINSGGWPRDSSRGAVLLFRCSHRLKKACCHAPNFFTTPRRRKCPSVLEFRASWSRCSSLAIHSNIQGRCARWHHNRDLESERRGFKVQVSPGFWDCGGNVCWEGCTRVLVGVTTLSIGAHVWVARQGAWQVDGPFEEVGFVF